MACKSCKEKVKAKAKAVVEEREREKERRRGFLTAIGVVSSAIGALASWIVSRFFGGGQ